MFRSPQLLASPSLKGTHRSLLLLLSKETLTSICPRHQKSRLQGRRALSLGFIEKSCCAKKEEGIQGKLPQDLAKERIIRKTDINPEPSDTDSLSASDELTTVSSYSRHLKLSLDRYFPCIVQPLSSTWSALPSHNHSQTNSPQYVINLETSGRSDHKCLLQHAHNQAGKQKGDVTTSCNSESLQHSHSSVSFLSGSHKLLFPRSLVSTQKLWTRSIVAGRLREQHLEIQACGMHGVAQLKVAPEYCLSAENEARCRKRLEPNTALYQKEKGKSWAAVLVSLCTEGGEPALLFTLRSSTLKGRHKGDVSFAGGKKDPADKDVVDTALREAREELGVTVRADQVWGVLKPLRDMSGMLIAPVLANLGSLESLTFRPNPSEVEEIFTLTLAHVCNPENRGYTHFRTGDRYGYTLPVFRNGKHRVWGLTAVALDHTLKLIVPS